MTFNFSFKPSDFRPESQEPESLLELMVANSKVRASSLSAMPMNAPQIVPDLFKMSRGFRFRRNCETISLPDPSPNCEPLSDLMVRRRSIRRLEGEINLADLATILWQALGPTAIAKDDTSQINQVLRAWPSAGGLYSLDTYIIVQRLSGVVPGLYGYNPIEHCLERLQSRPTNDVLNAGFFSQDWITSAAVVVVLVSVFDRLTSKYGEARAYRLSILDAGHAAQNLLLVATQQNIGSVANQGFADSALAEDLGIDGLREAVAHTIVLGGRTYDANS